MSRGKAALMCAALIALAGCSSHNNKPIHSGKIVALRYDPADPANGNHDCWRISFTGHGQIAYDCGDEQQWKSLKVGDFYRANGLADGEN